MTRPSCIDLLRVQAAATLDERGRIAGCYGVTIASCDDGTALWIGDEVPGPLASELAATVARASPPSEPGVPPPALEACVRLLDPGAGEPVPLSPSVSYVIADDVQHACDVRLVRSGEPGATGLRDANPGNWHPVEWQELLDGRLGPWAMAIEGDRVASICHTPGPPSERAAECGVWTAPACRGRGHAAATVAAWVPLIRAPGRHLFYNHDADNLSSQRVARRLGLRVLGWSWRLHRVRHDLSPLHPLCSLSPSSRASA